MKIYIEGSPLLKERSGIGQYTKRLLEAAATSHPEHSYTVFGFKFWTRPLPELPFPEKLGIRRKIIRFMPGRGYNLLFKYRLAPPVDTLLGARPDIVFFPNFVKWPILSNKTKTVLTIHDLSFIHFSQYTHPKNLPYMLKNVPYSIKRADHILTISESSKKQIVEYYKVNPEKITIVTPAVDHTDYYPRSKSDISKIRAKYNLPSNYVLYASTLEPRKNVNGVLDAYIKLDKKLKQKVGLVLAGGKGWKDESIIANISQSKKNGENITITGYVPDEDLPAIYSGAELFVYPSYYEGFGIPLLEAMACGVPVISADNSSLPEVVGKAGLYIKADDTNSLVSAMSRMLTDRTLANKYRLMGIEQARKFSWEKSANDLIRLFESLQKVK